MKKLIFAFTAFLLLANSLIAKEYSIGSPDDFNKIVGEVKPGDVIIVKNGNYSGWVLNIPTNGTAAQPVVIKAQTSGEVNFSGDVNEPIFLLTGSYTEVTGFNFTGCNVYKGGVLINLKGTDHCHISHCLFTKNETKVQFTPIVMVSGKGVYNKVDHCSFISNINNQDLQVKITADAVPMYTLISDNLFKDKDKVTWKVFNGGECVQIGQDPVLLGNAEAKSTVRDNTFIHCNGEAEVISNKSTGNKYIHNKFEDCQGELVMRGGHDCLIDSNTIQGGSGGIRVNGTHHTITHNNISGIKTAIRLMYGMAKGRTEIGFYIAAADCTIQYNTISGAATGILIGDSKNADWTGKFDTKKYPSRTMQDVPPSDNKISNNTFVKTTAEVSETDK